MARIGRVRVSRPDAVRRTSPARIRLDWTVLKVRHRSFPTSSGLRGSSTWVGRTRLDERNAKGPQESEMRGRDTRARQSATATGTSVTAVISIIGVAVPIALIVPIVTKPGDAGRHGRSPDQSRSHRQTEQGHLGSRRKHF